MISQNASNWQQLPIELSDSPSLPPTAEGVGEKKTPYSNTGSNSQYLSQHDNKGFGSWEPFQGKWAGWVDYLQGTAHCTYGQLQQLVVYLQSLYDDKYVCNTHTGYYVGNRRYAHCYKSLVGVIINWQPIADMDVCDDIIGGIPDTRNDEYLAVHISIPGKPLNLMGWKNSHGLLQLLHSEYDFSCSRIDAKVRDFSRITNMAEIDSALIRGDIKGGNYYHKYDSGTVKGNRELSDGKLEFDGSKGWSRVFGSPTSDKRVTFYDAYPVHGVDATDVEVRYRKVLAKTVFKSILGTETSNNNWGQSAAIIQSIVAGSIDFIHRIDGEKNLGRCERYSFWEKFHKLGEGAIRISRPPKAYAVVGQKHWIESQVSRSLAVCKEVMGELHFKLWIDDICKKGKSAFTKIHDAQIELYKQLGLHRTRFVSYQNDYSAAMSAFS